MTSPRVSVLLPARNAEATVVEACQSVLTQTFTDFELLVVNDGSTDRTLELVRTLEASDARVRILQSPGQGLVPALQHGLAQCRAPLIARMDADDLSHPERLALSVAQLEDGALAGVGTQVEVFRDDRPVSPALQSYVAWMNGLTSPEDIVRERFIESPLCHPSVMFRRDVVVAEGGWEEGLFPEDYQLWLKLMAAGHRLGRVPRVLLRWRDHDTRATRTDGRYARGNFVDLKARFLAQAMEAKCCDVWGAGLMGRRLARRLRAHGVEVQHLIDVDARKVGQRFDGFTVTSHEALSGFEGTVLVAAVGTLGARQAIRSYLRERGWAEGRDFFCAA